DWPGPSAGPYSSSNNSLAQSSSSRFLASSRIFSCSSRASRNIRCASSLAVWPKAPRWRGVFRELGKLQRLKECFDFGDECGYGSSPLAVSFSDLKKVQELLADQVAHRLFGAEILSNATGGSAPIRDDLFGGLGLPLCFGFPYRDLHCHVVAKVQAVSQMFLSYEFNLRDDARPNSPKHPAPCHSVGEYHLEFCPPYLCSSPHRLVRYRWQRVPCDSPRGNRQFGSEFPLIELFQAVALPDLLEAFRKSVVVDPDVQGSWGKSHRPVWWSHYQAISPRNDHLH